jgi:hypothetical protein
MAKMRLGRACIPIYRFNQLGKHRVIRSLEDVNRVGWTNRENLWYLLDEVRGIKLTLAKIAKKVDNIESYCSILIFVGGGTVASWFLK